MIQAHCLSANVPYNLVITDLALILISVIQIFSPYDLLRSGIEPGSPGGHANHYTTNVGGC